MNSCHNNTAKQISENPDKKILIALAGNPNVGKSTLFNELTGANQKIANYPGVTVEKVAGTLKAKFGKNWRILDLPGAYSLEAQSQDEEIAANCITGKIAGLAKPDLVVIIAEATKLDRSLLLCRQTQNTHPHVVLVLNMMDELKEKNLEIDIPKLEKILGIPVVGITAKTGQGVAGLIDVLQNKLAAPHLTPHQAQSCSFEEFDKIVNQVLKKSKVTKNLKSDKIDKLVLHPVFGPLLFLFVMYFLFKSLFTWAGPLMDLIDASVGGLAGFAEAQIPLPWLNSLVTDGIIAGVGSVIIFVPQIAITFLFIGLMEMTGYMARGGFLIDRLFRAVGLEGRSFVPLLSSFACAIPGVLATRTIPNAKQRLMTMLIAPLMTCSARLPVYTLLIAAFIPAGQKILGLHAQGFALFSLFLLGVIAALFMAFVLDKFISTKHKTSFLMELPKYRVPKLKNLYYYTSYRTLAFIKTAGTIIFVLSLILWALAYFPRSETTLAKFETERQEIKTQNLNPDLQSTKLNQIDNAEAGELLRESFMGQMGRFMEPVFKPMGFDWKLGIGVIASFAAREVFVSTMGIVYNLGEVDETSEGLRSKLQHAKKPDGTLLYTWRTALSLLIFFALASQCISTLAVIRRETNSWRWPTFVFAYMTGLAFLASTIAYQGLGWLGFL